MTVSELSVNRICTVFLSLLLLLSASLLYILYRLTGNRDVVLCGLIFSALFILSFLLFLLFIRKKLLRFSETLCGLLDGMMSGDLLSPSGMEEEHLFYKIHHRLVRLYEMTEEHRRCILKERTDLQELISDISHQVKTPIANLKMINATLLEQSVTEERRICFLTAAEGQLDKLDFLMQAMIMTSRLETGVITLAPKDQAVYETLAAALGGILLQAEQKDISVEVDCEEHLRASHDRKWTVEALFNILDNAVKYTPGGGRIHVSVENWDLYLRLDISDTGRGIPESHQAAIFKRFYREEEVHDTDGIGIGLYLARKIISLQGGYIKVSSEPGQGSVFSVFLPRGNMK